MEPGEVRRARLELGELGVRAAGWAPAEERPKGREGPLSEALGRCQASGRRLYLRGRIWFFPEEGF